MAMRPYFLVAYPHVIDGLAAGFRSQEVACNMGVPPAPEPPVAQLSPFRDRDRGVSRINGQFRPPLPDA
jgi:hypothetical protein